jgi:hypothetical protein
LAAGIAFAVLEHQTRKYEAYKAERRNQLESWCKSLAPLGDSLQNVELRDTDVNKFGKLALHVDQIKVGTDGADLIRDFGSPSAVDIDSDKNGEPLGCILEYKHENKRVDVFLNLNKQVRFVPELLIKT